MTFEVIFMTSSVVVAIGVIIAAVIATYKLFRKFDEVIGTDRRGRTLSDRLERVEQQLWENGGSSLADRVNNIEKHVVKVSTEIEIIKDITLGLRSAEASVSGPPQLNVRKKAS
jgi:phytoene/squalene synthetase